MGKRVTGTRRRKAPDPERVFIRAAERYLRASAPPTQSPEDAVQRALGVLRASLDLEGGTPEAAARAFRVARGLSARARTTLAEATKPGHDAVISDESWRIAREILEAHRPELEAMAGVVGSGLALRQRRSGVGVPELTATVYVERKLTDPELLEAGLPPIPVRLDGPGGGLGVDVVELGSVELFHEGGMGLGPSASSLRGTLGTLARDRATGELVALTAMHVSGQDEVPPGPSTTFTIPSVSEQPLAPLLGDLVSGTRTGVDAAKIRLIDQTTAAPRLKGIGEVRGWRPMVVPDDRGTVVRMYGAASGRVLTGQIDNPALNMTRPHLTSAILVDIPSIPGDSGAAIVDSQNLVLGLLVGAPSASESLRVFTPISLVLERLDCEISNPL